jgi:predicted chitinase
LDADHPLKGVLLPRRNTAESRAHSSRPAGYLGPADIGGIEPVRKRVNGGVIGLPEVRALYQAALVDLQATA